MREQPRLLVAGLDKDVRATPQDFFDKLNAEFGFTIDVCALPENAKCDRYFTCEDDGLNQPWAPHVCWCNPPYSEIRDWTSKAAEEAKKGATVVMLLPSSTDVAWFHDWVLPYAEIRFVRGRLKFANMKDPAPFGSIVAIYRSDKP